jgi:hypothetical protein
MKHTNLMIAPIFIRSETLSLKRNSKKTASVIFGKNVACNLILHWKNVACCYCIEKTARVIIASSLKKTSRVILKKKTASVILKEKKTTSV